MSSSVSSAVKIRLFPCKRAQEILDGQSKICNWLYNKLLEQANHHKQEYKATQNNESAKIVYSQRGLRNLIPGLKEEKPFLKVVHSSPLKNSALRLSLSIQSYQKSHKGERKGLATGWPKFRSWKTKWFSLLYDEPNKGFKIIDSSIKLSLGMGKDKANRYLLLPLESTKPLQGKQIRNLRITKENTHYYAVFTVLHAVASAKPKNRVIALDPNHKNLAYGIDSHSNAIEIAAPKWLKKYDIRLDELKSKRDKCLKHSKKIAILDKNGKATGKFRNLPSKRWQKYNQVLAKVYQKRREQTKTYLFTIANKLFKHYDVVAVGDYTPRGGGINASMRRAMNNRSLIGRFKEIASWCALKSGKHYIEYNETGTTRTCHVCNTKVIGGIKPNIRFWECQNCNVTHIRDENASINGLRQIINLPEFNNDNTLLVPSSGRVLIKKRRAWCVLPSGVMKKRYGGVNCDISQASGS